MSKNNDVLFICELDEPNKYLGAESMCQEYNCLALIERL